MCWPCVTPIDANRCPSTITHSPGSFVVARTGFAHGRAVSLLAGMVSFHDVNQRMHNKVMLFDDAVLITGGRNIENTYFDHSTGLNYRTEFGQ